MGSDTSKRGRAFLKAKDGRVTYYLPPELVKAVRHRAVDDECSASDVVAAALESYLGAPAAPSSSRKRLKAPRRQTASGTGTRAEWYRRRDAALARCQELQAEGLSLTQVAAKLNTEGHTTAQGAPWNKASLSTALRRARQRD